MKIHYTPITWDNRIRALCGHTTVMTTTDLRMVTCLRCIGAMSPGEKMHHEKNNTAYQEHVKKDGRRVAKGKYVISQKSPAHPVQVSISVPQNKPYIAKPRGRAANKSELQRLIEKAKGFFVRW